MPGISPEKIVHILNVDSNMKPIKQKRRKFAPERIEAMAIKVEKLLKAQFIQEVYYPHLVGQRSPGEEIQRKVEDVRGLHRPQQDLSQRQLPSLPCIDALVDSTSGYELLSFMDAFSSYSQILMHPEDREETAFITNRGLYCYKVMPFGLKNVGATYQRLVNKMFQN
jgi:hypothetical protein